VVLSLPAIAGGLSVGDFAFLSVQGAAIPWFHLELGAGLWGLSLLVALGAAVLVWRWRTAINERSGAPARRGLWALGVFLAVAAAGYVVAGGPLSADVPQPGRTGYEGGLQMSPEFAAVLIGLVVYTAAFIGETIRGAILSVQKGQKEAAEALGLSRTQQLRFVVLPQALRMAIPPINSQYLNLMKNTSLAIAIGFPDVASIGKTIINQKGHETEMLLLMMTTFLGLSLIISLVMNVLNRALAVKGERR
jgi:general L-amino acid transport system permease protein